MKVKELMNILSVMPDDIIVHMCMDGYTQPLKIDNIKLVEVKDERQNPVHYERPIIVFDNE